MSRQSKVTALKAVSLFTAWLLAYLTSGRSASLQSFAFPFCYSHQSCD